MMTFSNTFFLEVIFYTRKEEEQSHHEHVIPQGKKQQVRNLRNPSPSNGQSPALLQFSATNQVFDHFIGRSMSDQQGQLIPTGR